MTPTFPALQPQPTWVQMRPLGCGGGPHRSQGRGWESPLGRQNWGSHSWGPACPPCPSYPGRGDVALRRGLQRAGGASRAAGGHGAGTGVRAGCRPHHSSEEYQVAQAALARTFQGKFDKFVVPCVIASGDIQDRKGAEPLSFRCELRPGGVWAAKVTVPLLIPTDPGPGAGARWPGGRGPDVGGRDRVPPARPAYPQSPQHPVPGAVVSSGGTTHRSDIQQRQDHLQLRRRRCR